ncbi:hypothetical protein DMN91_004910 [Ooceraea biroi]|uniref:PPM-type phosphatase domain-containing protein n=2 Tax=Ooceraea biroi TaxID=2015173 RepID=A0A3L8DQT4_OOCBI|nr:flocculation protein FLO11 [Ooceraea biroi]RLU22632.1 hypothetical protein DMN91_004910 [Ooceraea biroi]
MAADGVADGDYLGAYSRFFAEFVARVNPDDQLPVKVSAYDVSEGELVGEIVSVTLQYLNQTYCPPSLQSYIVHLVIEAIKLTCKKQPEICGLRQQEKTYAPLKLMQAVINEVNEICRRYLDNSRLALLPPPSSTPQVTAGAIKNARRKMEDRHVVLHDLHTIFNIQDDTLANYYAVFDGHGGQDAAAYCATHLHQYLVESVHYPTDPERALRDAFVTTDEQFIAKSSTQKLNGGTTAVCALMLNKKLYIAWVGDSMAALVTRNSVMQLVNPHRPTRKDESERIQNMGGAVLQCMGVLRVNGFLSISRAIGDVPYKPYISGEPEVRCVPLDGTEDFLIIACDGLWDYIDQRTAALRVYGQVLQNPHDLKYVHQALLQSAKRAGSLDNITVIVVFLTPPVEIASRNSHRVPNGLLVNNMDPNNPFSSNSGQFDVNAAFIKQQQQQLDADIQTAANFEFDNNRLIFGKARNGKHEDDDDYDYGDLGPETDVDACEDIPDIARFPTSTPGEISPESEANVNPPMDMDSNNDNNENNDYLNRDNANVRPVEPMMVNDDGEVDNRYIRLSDREIVCDTSDETPAARDNDDDDDMCVEPGTHTVIDDDESPPSPIATKPHQHALISETENVVDSEDSEDEWNYYRIDPNKEESSATIATDESRKGVEAQTAQNSEPLADSLEVRSSEAEDDIKCEQSKKETSLPELVNIDISDAGKPCDLEANRAYANEARTLEQEADNEDMDFQLNPEAAEFVPLSPPLRGNRNHLQDYRISGSPLRQTPAMDDIPVPTQSEFEEEVSQRPREVDEKDFSSEEHPADHENSLNNMDVSEISSTKAEMGDESMARIMSSTQWQTNLSSQWSEKARDDAGSECEEYATRGNPMTMSYTPGDFEAAFKTGVDLNAVHDLSSDSAELANTPSRSPEPFACDERAHTPLSDKDSIEHLRAASTPQSANEKVPNAENEEKMNMETTPMEHFDVFSVNQMDALNEFLSANDTSAKFSLDECKSANSTLLMNPASSELNELINPFDIKSPSENIQFKAHDEQSLKSDEAALSRTESSLPEELVTQAGGNAKFMKDTYEEQEKLVEIGADKNADPFLIQDTLEPCTLQTEKESKTLHPEIFSNTTNNTITTQNDFISGLSSNTNIEEPTKLLFFSESPENNVVSADTTIGDAQPLFTGLNSYVENKALLLDKDPDPNVDRSENLFVCDSVESLTKSEEKQKDSKVTDIETFDVKQDSIDLLLRPSIVEQEQRRSQTPEKAPLLSEQIGQEQRTEKEGMEVTSTGVTETFEKKVESEDISPSKEATLPKDVGVADKSKEIVAKLGALTVGAAAGTATSVTSVAKSKTTTTTATKRSTKPTAATTKATVSTKPATKSTTPTSPSKTFGATARTTVTSTQSTTARKPAASSAARPKQLDGSAKPAVSSVGGKATVTKTSATSSKTTTATTATRTAASPRIGTTKPRLTATASPRLNTGTSAERKPTASGDAKPASKSAAKPTSTAVKTSSAKTTLVKSSSTTTRTSTSTLTSKPRPASAAVAAKPTSTIATKQSSTSGVTSTRPKTAPVTSSTRPRESTTRTATAKSPMTDKQSKETVNKQISRAGALSAPKTTTRVSGITSTTTTVRRTSAKAPASNASATSPTKKSTLTSKVASKAPAGTKKTPSSETKVLQNGILEKKEDKIKAAVITAAGDKPEEDVPRKDTSPLDVPTDNQLITD